jgi:hypothetical protein
MAAGTIVYLNGATGNLPTIAKALATSDATSAQTIGLVQTSIANNGSGLVVVRGVTGSLDTSALTEGQQLYLSPSVAGTYTTTKQFAPNHLVYIGVVTRAHPTIGSIEVAVQNGFEMDELHNVSAQSPANGDTLRWNSATSLWEKSALGTLATQSGTFSGTSSGTNTGDQTATTVSNTPAGGIAATTVQAAINELDTEKTTPAAALAAADAADLSATAALIEREGLRFDGTAGAVIGGGGIPAVGTGDWSFVCEYSRGVYGSLIGGDGNAVLAIRISTDAVAVLLQNSVQMTFSGTIPVSGVLGVTKSSGLTTARINGTQIDAAKSDANNYTTAETTLGMSYAGGTPVYLTGVISHASKWNYALTASEIDALERRGLVTLPEQRGGSMVALTAGSFIVGKRYRIVTVGTTSFTGLGASANTVGVEFTTTGVGTGTGTALPLGTLFEQDSGQRNAGYMVRDTSGNKRHLELPETGVSIIDPADTGFIEYTRATDGYLIGDRRVIPSTGYLVEVVATGNGTVTLGESAGTPANVCASVTLTSTPKILPILVTQTSTGKLYADLGTATTATFKIRHRAV